MNILLVTSEIGTDGGGLALTSLQLVTILEKCGCRVQTENSLVHNEYFAIDGGYDPELGKKIRYSVHLKTCVEKYSQDFCPDILIAYGAGANGYFTCLLAAKLKKPFFVVLCGSEINISFASVALSFYNRTVINCARKVIGLSQELLDNAKIFDDNVGNDKYFLVPNAYDFPEEIFYSESKISLENRLIFATGSTFLSEKKGIANLINAFSLYLKRSGRNDILQLYGKIDADILVQYQQLIAANHAEKNIFLCGYLRREIFNTELKNVDVYIQLSPFEGCCNAIGEAISNGKFVLISDTGYFAERLKEKFPHLVLSSLQPEEIADSLEKYIHFVATQDVRQKLVTYLAPFVNFDKIKAQWEKILHITEQRDIQPINKVVMFHDVTNAFSGIDYPQFAFKKLVELMTTKGYRFCSYAEFVRTANKKNLIVCTFDDAYENVFRNVRPVMNAYNFSATIFVCPDLIGKSNDWNRRDEVVRFHMDKDMLLQLQADGWEIGSHGLGHYNLLRLSQTELEECLRSSKELLSADFADVKCFCYPYGEHKKFIRDMVSKFYEVAFSVSVGGNDWQRDRYQMSRIVPEELKKILERIS